MPTAGDPAEGASPRRLVFGRFVVDQRRGELTRDGQAVPLRRKAFELLVALASRPGELRSKDELLAAVWPGVVVGEDSLAQCMHELRTALGEPAAGWIRTVPRRGYRFDAEVVAVGAQAAEVWPAPPAPAPAPAPAQAPAPDAPARARRRFTAPALVAVVLATVALAVGGYVAKDRRADAAQALLAPRGSVVVLPLEAEADSEAGTWFSDPLTADLTTDLGRYSGIVVISRETAFGFRGRQIDPREIARQLNVRYVVRGTVRRHADEVRLNLALVDGVTGQQRWSERFVVSRADLRAALAQVSGTVSRALGVEVWRAEGQRAATLRPDQVEADDLAMRGWAVWFQGLSRENTLEALRWFEQAVARDPDSIRGWGGISLMHGTAVSSGWADDVGAARERQREATRELERIDGNDFLTQMSRIAPYYERKDFTGLLAYAGELARRFPNLPHTHHQQANALLQLGRFDECLEPIRKAIRLGPRDTLLPYWHSVSAFCHFFAGRHAESVDEARRAVQANAALVGPQLILAAALARNGQADEAREIVREWQRHRAFKAQSLHLVLLGDEPRLAEGRARLIATLEGLGVP